MAKSVSLKSTAKAAAGLPSREQLLMAPQNTDTVPAVMNPAPQGLPGASPSQGPQPAKLTQGEFVFSIPAIIGLGDGDYKKGLATLTKIHTQLQAYGEKLMGGGQGDPSVQQQPPQQGLPQQGQ